MLYSRIMCNTTQNLTELRQELVTCVDEVSSLQQLSELNGSAEVLVDLTHDVGNRLRDSKERFGRALRKQIAIESQKLIELLEEARKMETTTEWKNRRHDVLYASLNEYRLYHMTV
eukprot:GHVO01016767.1.p1 GENE.GHVO01016767.1~~GHVO01016767.1.p1  ORF type:complete len:116 (-),score=17.41 GHVO01016767.1:103-450(-)